MNISLSTDSSIDAAIDRRRVASNLSDGGKLTSEEYANLHLIGLLQGWVAADKLSEASLVMDAFVKGDASKQSTIKTAAGL